MTYQYIQLSYLDTIAAGDQQIRQTLLDMVRKEITTTIPNMEQALKEKDWETFHGIVHQLKSTLAFAGNPELTKLNQHLLSNLEQKNYQADLSAWLQQYKRLSVPVADELKKESDKFSISSSQ